MANAFDAFNAARDNAYGQMQQIRQRRALQQAGSQLQAGNMQGAAGDLYGAGMLDEGLAVQRFQQGQEDRQRRMLSEDRQLAAAEAERRARDLITIASRLKGVQKGQRAAKLREITPVFQQIGIDPTPFASLGEEDLSDENLDLFAGAVQRELEIVKGSDGSYSAVDTSTGLPVHQYQAPQKPEYRTLGEGQTLVEVGGGARATAQPSMQGGVQEAVQQLIPGVRVTSGRRTPERNAAVGGAPNSHHLTGNALDLTPPAGMSMKQLEDQLRASGLPLRELINEGDHVHIAWAGDGLPQGATTDGGARVIAQGPPKREDPLKALQAQNLIGQIQERQQKITETAEKRQRQVSANADKAKLIMSTVDSAIRKVGHATSGFVGGNLSDIKGTPAYDLAREVETIRSNLGFAELQAMREASPTGGALGQVAVQELVALQATVANLDTGQSPDQLRANLRKIKSHYQKWLNAVERAEGGQQAQGQGRVRRYNPATGRLE